MGRFISKHINVCKPLFDLLKKGSPFEWNSSKEDAFKIIKETLGKPPILSQPLFDKKLSFYLSVTETAMASVLIREKGGVEKSIYFISKTLKGPELRYAKIEKIGLLLYYTAKQL